MRIANKDMPHTPLRDTSRRDPWPGASSRALCPARRPRQHSVEELERLQAAWRAAWPEVTAVVDVE